ncbi:ABC transporter permease [Archaeoglobus veneficus]|uniref:ABC-type transporter, integral membrane subunit n=1 Tax=Archaeoglobus veneficus (strain DSM 11195 / SNP6) TaxID=693661 RepID=F2KQ41_ARCVS|nr:ABC transporter permease [Archaeoglobus veneficus]AEA47644.1 ABC-type transporter, integral membrane subunit [Archaeoglobus veneficus SNP6]
MIVKRLATALLVMFFASFLSFSLLYLAPGNVAEAVLKEQLGFEPTEDEVVAFMARYNLDQPFLVQYYIWLKLFVTGKLVCPQTGDSVIGEFLYRFPVTLTLAFSAVLFATTLGIPLGIVSAIRKDSIIDNVCRIIASLGVSIPSFWLALLLILFFCVKLKLLPAFGLGGLKNMILPTIALGLHIFASITRVMRGSMLEVLNEQYILVSRAKGLPERAVIIRHALRNAVIPVVTLIGLQFGHLLGGAVIIESIFSLPGIGKFLMDSIFARDYIAVSGFVVFIAFLFVVVNLIVDIVYMILDPRVRVE